MEATLYTRAGCHLCQELKDVLAPLLAEFGVALQEVDVDTDSQLRARYGEEVPVVFLDGRLVAKHRIAPREFRLVLERFVNRTTTS